jgi:C-terminal processing protease CtpA/Prc
MNYLCGADALIIDLRNNSGGTAAMVQLIISYFFSDKPVHLNSFYWRRTDTVTETWTLPELPGKLRPDIDLYILTSSQTFSGGEEFAYDLKNLKRATLIGETTGGGANIGAVMNSTRRFKVFIPFGRAINPITQTNWEGVGVEPHIKTTSEAAFDTARSIAFKKLKK